MNENLMQRLKQLKDLGKQLYKEGLIACSVNDGSMHFKEEAFIELCGDNLVKLDIRNSFDYPYEYTIVIDGVKCFCISNEDNLIKNVERVYE